jgi:hypothetical protein
VISSAPNWRAVPGYEGYYSVSDCGLVRSDRFGRMLKPARNHKGYLVVALCRGNARKFQRVHVLVLAAFVGPRASGMETAHLNGKRDDNRLENLKWATHSENESHKVAHGTAWSSKSPNSAPRSRHAAGALFFLE